MSRLTVYSSCDGIFLIIYDLDMIIGSMSADYVEPIAIILVKIKWLSGQSTVL